MRQRMYLLFITITLSFFCARLYAGLGATEVEAQPARSFDFDYVVHVPALPAGHHNMRIWLPLPSSGEHQKISRLRINSGVSYQLSTDPQYHNTYAYFHFDPSGHHTPFQIELNFQARRYEYRVLRLTGDPAASRASRSTMEGFLQPDRLVPIDGLISEISREQTAGTSDPLLKARAIYDYVIRSMHYDHAGTGWGRGDAVWACSSHHGNCTDFHSLFIGLARAAGIPARFDIGFSLPVDRHEGKISGYHCWAEFYIQDTGWIPIDAAEGWQMAAKQDYFFGALDENRVRFTTGRDLVIKPTQQGDPLNYFVYPYAELDGRPFADLESDFYFKDLQ